MGIPSRGKATWRAASGCLQRVVEDGGAFCDSVWGGWVHVELIITCTYGGNADETDGSR